jgi:hypothetical protein
MTDPDDIDEQRLLAAYRALPRPEPSAALDAAVLAHARAVLPAARRARPRWVTGLATAAVLTLAVGTGWQLREAPLGDGPSSPAPIESDHGTGSSDAAVAEALTTDDDVANKAEAKLGTVEAEDKPADRMRDSTPRQNREERQAATQDSAAGRTQAARPLIVPEPPAAAAVPAPSSVPPPAAPPPAPPAPPAPATPPAPSVMQEAPAASTLPKASGRAVEGGARVMQRTVDTPLADPAPRADRAPNEAEVDELQAYEGQAANQSAPRTLSPLEWLDAIRRMRDHGDARRAADALAQFRAVYPDEPVPDDLKNLLP